MTIDIGDFGEAIRAAAAAGVAEALAPYLQRLSEPEPLAWSVRQTAAALGVSRDTIERFVREGRLPKLDGTERVLIPRAAVERLVADADERSRRAHGHTVDEYEYAS